MPCRKRSCGHLISDGSRECKLCVGAKGSEEYCWRHKKIETRRRSSERMKKRHEKQRKSKKIPLTTKTVTVGVLSESLASMVNNRSFWLTGEIINAAVKIFNTLATKATALYCDDANDLFYGKYKQKTSTIWHDVIFIPFNNLQKTHWVLVVLFLKKSRFIIVDSLQANTQEGTPFFLEIKRALDNFPIKKKWKLVTPIETIHQQANSNDCGMFVILNMFSLYFYKTYVQQTQVTFEKRKYLAYCIRQSFIPENFVQELLSFDSIQDKTFLEYWKNNPIQQQVPKSRKINKNTIEILSDDEEDELKIKETSEETQQDLSSMNIPINRENISSNIERWNKDSLSDPYVQEATLNFLDLEDEIRLLKTNKHHLLTSECIHLALILFLRSKLFINNGKTFFMPFDESNKLFVWKRDLELSTKKIFSAIFAPVFIPPAHDGHFVLVIFLPIRSSYIIVDPLRNKKTEAEIKKSIHSKRNKLKKMDNDWKDISQDFKIEQQTNVFDCGVFVILNIINYYLYEEFIPTKTVCFQKRKMIAEWLETKNTDANYIRSMLDACSKSSR